MDTNTDSWHFHKQSCAVTSIALASSAMFFCDLHSPENYQCKKCQFQSHLKILSTVHFDTVHKKKETQHYPTPVLRCCENCGFQTYSSLVLLSHDCCGSNGNKVSATSTSKISNTSFGYIKHETGKNHSNHLIHTKKKKNEHVLNTQHMQLANQEKPEQFKCDQCLYETTKRRNLKIHTLQKHTPSEQINWIQCDQCSYKTIRNGDLKGHKRQKHTPLEQIDWFKCEHCLYKSKLKCNLRKHVLARHSQPKELEKLKRFKCEQCPYKAQRNDHLREHTRRMHPLLEKM